MRRSQGTRSTNYMIEWYWVLISVSNNSALRLLLSQFNVAIVSVTRSFRNHQKSYQKYWKHNPTINNTSWIYSSILMILMIIFRDQYWMSTPACYLFTDLGLCIYKFYIIYRYLNVCTIRGSPEEGRWCWIWSPCFMSCDIKGTRA